MVLDSKLYHSFDLYQAVCNSGSTRIRSIVVLPTTSMSQGWNRGLWRHLPLPTMPTVGSLNLGGKSSKKFGKGGWSHPPKRASLRRRRSFMSMILAPKPNNGFIVKMEARWRKHTKIQHQFQWHQHQMFWMKWDSNAVQEFKYRRRRKALIIFYLWVQRRFKLEFSSVLFRC